MIRINQFSAHGDRSSFVTKVPFTHQPGFCVRHANNRPFFWTQARRELCLELCAQVEPTLWNRQCAVISLPGRAEVNVTEAPTEAGLQQAFQ